MTRRDRFTIIGLSLAIGLFWFCGNFLASEDASVLFNRANHLQGATTFFFHAGYASIHPQAIAALVSPLPPLAQALVYSTVAFAIWCLMFLYVCRISGNLSVTLALIAYFSIFDQIYVVNLTYSLWTGLVLSGLIGLNACIEDRPLKTWEALLTAGLALASPLSIFLLPLFAYRAWRWRRDYGSRLVVLFLLAAYVILPDPDSQRAAVADMARRLPEVLELMLRDPLRYMLDPDLSAVLTFRALTQWAALVLFLLGWPLLIWRVTAPRARAGLALLGLGVLTAYLVSLAVSELPLQSRYWFPVTVCAGLVTAVALHNAPARLSQGLMVLFLLAALAAHGQRALNWSGVSHELAQLTQGHTENQAITRTRYDNGIRWAIGLGSYDFSLRGCTGRPYHRDAAAHGFRIFCGKPLTFPGR
jgi:hypothetical protein